MIITFLLLITGSIFATIRDHEGKFFTASVNRGLEKIKNSQIYPNGIIQETKDFYIRVCILSHIMQFIITYISIYFNFIYFSYFLIGIILYRMTFGIENMKIYLNAFNKIINKIEKDVIWKTKIF